MSSMFETCYGEENVEETDQEWEEFAKMVALKKQKEEKDKRDSSLDLVVQDDDGYESTIMYGRYSRQLGEFARLESLKNAEKKRKKEDKQRRKELRGYQGKISKTIGFLWKHTFAKLGEDWVFLALLGIIMACLSFLIDRGIGICNSARGWLYRDLNLNNIAAEYFAWICLPVTLILFAAGWTHLIGPQAVGSGIPEMKTILRGVTLKEYLTFRTLVAKVVGLTATLGAGMPLGKEGPFVHIASMSATLLSKLITGFQGIYQNESRNTEMLAAACAVGVACCFAAPVGGVLFSIEVTTTYFYVRNYFRGFFAAVWGATMFRLLHVWFLNAHTATPHFETHFIMDFPFDPQELFIFAIMGVACGIGGAAYICCHKRYVLFMRGCKPLSNFLRRYRFLYPGFVALLVSSLMFPPGVGKYIAGDVSTHNQVLELFSNFTWSNNNLTAAQQAIVQNWSTDTTGVFINLGAFCAFTFFFSILCLTMPVPTGVFVPVLKIGAGFGRLIGELMNVWFPNGLRYGGHITKVVPGGYATVGAAAFSGAVTHTISTSVIVFEMTGQITHVIPILIAVLLANGTCSLLAPSFYDSGILIKKLPYLPDLLPSSSGMYNIYVEDFMVRDVKYIYQNMTYNKLKLVLKENRILKMFPLVDSPDGMILLGSIQRMQLIQLIERHIGRERRLQVNAIRIMAAQEKAREEAVRRALEQQQERERRPSRFQVSPAPDVLVVRQLSETTLDRPGFYHPQFGTFPKKSILKKTNSFTLKGFTNPFQATSPGSTPYTTVTGAESRIRSAFEAIFRKSTQLQDVENNGSVQALDDNGPTPQILPMSSKKVQLPRERVCDMSAEDQRIWEEEQMQLPVDFSACHIDPAPFQLVERTSLLKVHSLFSMVGVNIAYVTAIGKLVGVVGLKELRKAIEDANSGNLPPHDLEIRVTPTRATSPTQQKDEETGASDSEAECKDTATIKV